MLTALLIFVATIVLVVWQPKGLGVGWSAMAGAALALLTGVVELADIPTVWGFVWNATFTFIRSEEHTSELQSLMRISSAVFCLKKKKHITEHTVQTQN